MSSLLQSLREALARRQLLLTELAGQGTECYRLFHGSQEGAPGLTVDRYGPQLLVQSFHQPLPLNELLSLTETCSDALQVALHLVYNDRSGHHSRIDRSDPVYSATSSALEDQKTKQAVQPESDQQGAEGTLEYGFHRAGSSVLRVMT